MAHDGGGSSEGGTRSGLVGIFGKATGVVLAATALIVALETFLEKGESFTCRLGTALPWCETPLQECSQDNITFDEWFECHRAD